MDIGKIDRNLAVPSLKADDDAVFYSAKAEPFDGYGFYDFRGEPGFRRMPDDVARSVSRGVASLYRKTAGGRLRFTTDSSFIILRCRMSGISKMVHMPLISSAGFDLYIDCPEDGSSRFYDVFRPTMDMTDGFEAKVTFGHRKIRSLTLNFPSYSNVDELLVGLEPDAVLSGGSPYLPVKPIVYYGSSITQGACASRPGNAYQNIICRRNRTDYINLGFAGSAKGEATMAHYLAGLEMSAFVSDYDHNATLDTLTVTHSALYRTIRENHPDIPYVIVTMPDLHKRDYDVNQRRRDICYGTYIEALRAGDRNISFVDGGSLFAGANEDCCTVDTIHPNDYGMLMMADRIGAELDWIRAWRTQK